MQAIAIVGRFQETPIQRHLLAAKRILKYLREIMGYGLWYPRCKKKSFTVYTDVDWAGDMYDKKITIGGALFLGDFLVSWLSKKKASISLSTTEAKHISSTSCCTQLFYMKKTLQEVQVFYDQSVPIIYDNTSVISMSKNHSFHSKTKHIPIKYHFLREQVANQIVKLEYVTTKEQVVDIFIKPLPR